jgi:polyhydroxybutyrate depolymerase
MVSPPSSRRASTGSGTTAREGRNSSIDDVAFLRQLVHELIGHRIADPARLYLAGISNGGMMTFRLLCEHAELFAGPATMIANMPAGVGEHCSLRKPVPLVMFNGTADPLVRIRAAASALRAGAGQCGGRSAPPNLSPRPMPAALRA